MPAKKANSTSFKPGKSANPTGRPPGTTPRAKFRKLIESDMPDIIAALVANAKAGDSQAAKILVDRYAPALKPTSADLSLRTTGTLEQRGEAIIAALTRGTIPPETALVAMNALSAQAKLTEQSEIIKRLDQLEALTCQTAKP